MNSKCRLTIHRLESEQRMQLSGVFRNASPADFGRAEPVLYHSEGVPDIGAHARF